VSKAEELPISGISVMMEIPEALSCTWLLLHDQAELSCCQYRRLRAHAFEDMKSDLKKKSRQGEDKRTRLHQPGNKAENL